MIEQLPCASHSTPILLSPMRIEDIEHVTQIERRCYALPWSPSAYATEIGNPNAYYTTAKDEAGRVVGYAGMWIIMDEIHITTIAVDPSRRGQGIGERLLLDILEEGMARGADRATLEVRERNTVAHNLYRKYGFADVATRRNYYSDNGENAIIMWTNNMFSTEYLALLHHHKQHLQLSNEQEYTMSLKFTHRFIPGSDHSDLTLLLLHGTGGNENSLLDLAKSLAPKAALLAPRGQVLEQGMPRFFRRLAEGVFDEADLIQRTQDLAEFAAASAQAYNLNPRNVIAVGFSNGANIAAALLLLHPTVLRGAVLLSPMVPLEPDSLPDLSDRSIFIGAGSQDPLVPAENTKRLVDLFRHAGADVTVYQHPGGHTVTPSEVSAAAQWLGQQSPII